jgi:hypothetical protein
LRLKDVTCCMPLRQSDSTHKKVIHVAVVLFFETALAIW